MTSKDSKNPDYDSSGVSEKTETSPQISLSTDRGNQL